VMRFETKMCYGYIYMLTRVEGEGGFNVRKNRQNVINYNKMKGNIGKYWKILERKKDTKEKKFKKKCKKKRLFGLKGVNGDDWSRSGNCRDLGVNGKRKWQWCANITEFWRGKFNSGLNFFEILKKTKKKFILFNF